MKKFIVCLFLAASLVSCKDYGKKIKIEGTNVELFYKNGVTETEAKSAGDFLKKEYVKDDKAASTQLTKEGDVYTLRLVYDQKYYEGLKNADLLFKQLGAKASKQVFGGKKVTIALADENFKDFKTLPYDEEVAKALDAPAITPEGFGYKEHHAEGDVNFYWKDITEDEAKVIGQCIAKNNDLTMGHTEFYMSKEDMHYFVKFIVKESAINDPASMAIVEKAAKEIKDCAFANETYSFMLMDTQFKPVKSFDY